MQHQAKIKLAATTGIQEENLKLETMEGANTTFNSQSAQEMDIDQNFSYTTKADETAS